MALDIAPSLEAEIVQRAAVEGISPDQLIDRLLHHHSRQNGPNADETGDFGGKSVFEAFEDIIGTESFEPTDLGRRAEDYLAGGFGASSSPGAAA